MTDFTLNLKNGEMSLTLSEAATQELYDAQAAAQQQAASQPSGSLVIAVRRHGQPAAGAAAQAAKPYLCGAGHIYLFAEPAGLCGGTRCKISRCPMIYDVLPAGQTSIWVSMLPMLIITVVVMGAFYYFVYAQGGGGKAMNVGRAKVKDQADQGRKATFADVAGADEEKEELAEIVEFLKNQQRFQHAGGTHPARCAAGWPSGHRQNAAGPGVWRARRACPSIPFPARILWRCMWAWARPACATCLNRRRKTPPCYRVHR